MTACVAQLIAGAAIQSDLPPLIVFRILQDHGPTLRVGCGTLP